MKQIPDKGGSLDETQSVHFGEGLSYFYPVWYHGDVVEGPVVALLQGDSGEENPAVAGEDRLLVLVAGRITEEIQWKKYTLLVNGKK